MHIYVWWIYIGVVHPHLSSRYLGFYFGCCILDTRAYLLGRGHGQKTKIWGVKYWWFMYLRIHRFREASLVFLLHSQSKKTVSFPVLWELVWFFSAALLQFPQTPWVAVLPIKRCVVQPQELPASRGGSLRGGGYHRPACAVAAQPELQAQSASSQPSDSSWVPHPNSAQVHAVLWVWNPLRIPIQACFTYHGGTPVFPVSLGVLQGAV